LDAKVTFVSVSGDAIFKKRKPTIEGKNEYTFGNGTGGKINAKTVSGDLIINTEEGTSSPIVEKSVEEKLSKHDPDAERIVYTYLQGIITLEEAKEMLKILEYDEQQSDKLIEAMLAEFKGKNIITEEENPEKEQEVCEDEEKSS
jgi:hypothetical protein